MSDIEVDVEAFEPCPISENKEKDLSPEKDQYSSDSDSEYYEQRKNEFLIPKTKEEKQKQNEEIVISSCSTSHCLPNFDNISNDRLNHNETKAQENHYFIDASSLLDDSELTYTSLTLRNTDTKPTNSKITKLKADICDQEFTTEFQTEIKVTNLEFNAKTSDVPSTSFNFMDKRSENINFREINKEMPSTSSESFMPINLNYSEMSKNTDLPSTSSEKSYISLNSFLDKNELYENEGIYDLNTQLKSDFETAEKENVYTVNDFKIEDRNYLSLDSHHLNKTLYPTGSSIGINTNIKMDIPSTSSKNCYASLDSHILNKNLRYCNTSEAKKECCDKKTGFVRSGTFEIDSEELLLRKNNEKRQGMLIFQSSIQQFSGHSLEPENIIPTTPFNSIIHINDNIIVNQSLIEIERPLNGVFYDKSLDNFEENGKFTKSDTVDSLASLCEAQIKRENSVPIISGGILPQDYEMIKNPEIEQVIKNTPKSAWVVDMSSPPPTKKVEETSSEHKPNQKSSLGFFIDLTEEPKKISKPEPENDIKKNIFSMSIEFQAPKKGMPSRLSQSLSAKKQTSEITSKSDIKKEVIKRPETTENSVKSSIQLRHTRTNSNASNRHSWNGPNDDSTVSSHRRTYSLSEKMCEHANLTIDIKDNDVIHLEQENDITCDIPTSKNSDIITESEKIKKPVNSRKNKINNRRFSNHDINNSGESSNPDESSNYQSGNEENKINCQKHNHQIEKPKGNGIQPPENCHKTNDTNAKNCVNDESLQKNGKKVKDDFQSSTVTSTTQERIENHVELKRKNDNKSTNQTVIIINHDDIVINQIEETTSKEVTSNFQVETADSTELEKPSKSEGFVSLSDLDKAVPKIVTEEPVYTRMTRSIPETSWIENKLLMSRSIGCRLSSKILTNMSTSTPAFCVSNAYAKGLGHESDEMMSELSDFSSIQSSTALELSTEETSQSLSTHHHSNRLGTDLLRMFLEEISPDVTICAGGRRMRAHKCILSSRCQYFAAMLSGGHVEREGNVISLEGYSFQAVYFAMCHIYSGAADIPESIDLVELATLADMLGLEGLKEVVASTLKLKYCHMFHKPCSVCIVGIIETLQLAFTYSLDDLYRKCLKWITRYFVRVWCTRAFAGLTRELHDKCYQQHVVHMSADNVLETMLCVIKLLATLPNVRWAEIVSDMAERLKDECDIYLIEHFASVLGSASFLSLGKELNWNISKVEGSLLMAAESLSPEQACRSYARIVKLQAFLQIGDECWSVNFTELTSTLYSLIESTVVRQAVRVSHSPSWAKLDSVLRARIQELACMSLEAPPPPRPSSARRQTRSTSGNRNLDLRQVRIAMQMHTRRVSSETRSNKSQVTNNTKPIKPVEEPQPPRPRTWPAQTQLKTKIISSSDSSRTSSPAFKRGAKKLDQIQPKPVEKLQISVTQPKPKQIIPTRPKTDTKITTVKTVEKSKVKPTPTIKQNITNSQKTIKTNIIKTNIVKVSKVQNKAQVNKENRTSGNISKNGSNSSTQQSPSKVNKKQQSSSNSTPSSQGQVRSDSNTYSSSPSLRRSLLLAAKAPQVPVKPVSPATNKRLARIQASNSLTSPTKASAAKCVNNNQKNKQTNVKQKTETKKVPDKPMVERSGTFLKDEPTVLTKA